MTAALVTWLWQGMALALLLSMALRLLPRVNAATRHVLWWGAFAALIAIGWQSLPVSSVAAGVATTPVARFSNGSWLAVQAPVLPAWALSFLMVVWAAMACVRLLRIVPGLHVLYLLKDECRAFPAGVEKQLRLWHEGGSRHVRLALCDGVPGAALLGLRDPCIAIPSSLVAELHADDLDQIILHEYAHVQRRDDWMRLLQTVLEAALWVHPAAYFIGRKINFEREAACDDWVIARTGAPKEYARCLSRVAEHLRAAAAPAFAQALFGRQRDLLRRVDRLLDGRCRARRTASLPATALGAVAIAICAAHLHALLVIAMPPTSSIFDRPSSIVAAEVQPMVENGRLATDAVRPITEARQSTTDVPRPTMNVRRRTMDDGRSTIDDRPPTMDDGRSTMNDGEQMSVLYPTRMFEGVYVQPDDVKPDDVQRNSGQTPISGVVKAGVGIANAGVGMANAFTRVGTGLARRF